MFEKMGIYLVDRVQGKDMTWSQFFQIITTIFSQLLVVPSHTNIFGFILSCSAVLTIR